MAYGIASGLWPLAYGLWPTASGLCGCTNIMLHKDDWRLTGVNSLAYGPIVWAMAYGMAYGMGHGMGYGPMVWAMGYGTGYGYGAMGLWGLSELF